CALKQTFFLKLDFIVSIENTIRQVSHNINHITNQLLRTDSKKTLVADPVKVFQR
ncbi:7919_t:CDS:1, partial [Funneliformis geosporum]